MTVASLRESERLSMSFLANRPRAAASATPSAAARPTGAGRYAGLRSDNRLPRLVKGSYVIEITSTRFHEGFNGKNWFLEGKVLEATDGSANPVGQSVSIQVSLKSAKAELTGMSKIKRIACVATGHDSDIAFEEAYPTWEDLIDRMMGFDVDEEAFGPNPLGGGADGTGQKAKIRVEASNSGKTAEDGSHFQNYAFSVCED
jgi:hypothetical protein